MADPSKLKLVAQRVVSAKKNGYDVVVVVSAMGKTTDNLLQLAKSVSDNPTKRELDMLLSSGERITMSLLSMAIQTQGYEAISLTGSQSGIITNDSHANARIIDVKPVRILDELEKGRVVIVAGFQGMSYKREVTTLGRGGSDTTAVALAGALGAEICEICSDVDAVYTSDPRVVKDAKPLRELTYNEMLALSEGGAKVLNPEAIAFAEKHDVKIYSTATFGVSSAGTYVLRKANRKKYGEVVGLAFRKRVHIVRYWGSSEDAARLFDLLNDYSMPFYNLELRDEGDGMTFIRGFITPEDAHGIDSFIEKCKNLPGKAEFPQDLGSVTLAGEGITETTATSRLVWRFLKAEGFSPLDLRAAAHRITVHIRSGAIESASQKLHEKLIGAKNIND